MEKTHIRKISIGEGHPDKMMHYQVGKEYNLGGSKYILSDILLDRELLDRGKLAYNLYIYNESEGKVCWKTLIDLPMVVENNISFD